MCSLHSQVQVNLTLAHELEAGGYDAGDDDITLHNLVFEEVRVRVCVCVCVCAHLCA